jgi:hypothetical protein
VAHNHSARFPVGFVLFHIVDAEQGAAPNPRPASPFDVSWFIVPFGCARPVRPARIGELGRYGSFFPARADVVTVQHARKVLGFAARTDIRTALEDFHLRVWEGFVAHRAMSHKDLLLQTRLGRLGFSHKVSGC